MCRLSLWVITDVQKEIRKIYFQSWQKPRLIIRMNTRSLSCTTCYTCFGVSLDGLDHLFGGSKVAASSWTGFFLQLEGEARHAVLALTIVFLGGKPSAAVDHLLGLDILRWGLDLLLGLPCVSALCSSVTDSIRRAMITFPSFKRYSGYHGRNWNYLINRMLCKHDAGCGFGISWLEYGYFF